MPFPLNCSLRYFVRSIALSVLLIAAISGGGAGFAQESSSNPEAQAQAAEPQPVSEQVTAAEAAIAASDWKTAEAKLDPWLAQHPQRRARPL